MQPGSRGGQGISFRGHRVGLGLGDAERELGLLPALADADDLQVAERCLSADELIACSRERRIDVALAALDLHRLGEEALGELIRTRIPLVLLVPTPAERRWRETPAIVLPLDPPAPLVRTALEAALQGKRLPAGVAGDQLSDEDEPPGDAQVTPAPAASDTATLIVVAGGGSPGRSTVAVSLATALGAVAPTILLDTDVSGPTIAAHLDADPTRNLYMVAHAQPETPREWERALDRELQPLDSRSPHGAVLCGVPKPEMAGSVTSHFLQQLMGALRQRARWVVADLGEELLGGEAAASAHRALLAMADQVLLVGATDLVGLWQLRAALGLLQRQTTIPAERLAVVLNRHDRRYHHGRTEIEWTLGVPTAAVIPADHDACQRAVAAQRPVVLQGRRGAPAALLDLAERIQGGRVVLPPEPSEERRPLWLPGAVPWLRGAARTSNGSHPAERNGVSPHGDRIPAQR